MTARRKLTDSGHFEVAYTSARRCCMCFALENDFTQKSGQIAHLDQDRSNDSLANLAWLCLSHHDQYDSRTSQSKGYSAGEVKRYRDLLLAEVARWRQTQPHQEGADAYRYKQQLIEQNVSLFFFAAMATREQKLRETILAEVSDLDFKAQLLEAWAFIDQNQEQEAEPALSRQDLMARYIGATDEGKEDLKILLGLAGAAISAMNEHQRNDALFSLHSDTVRSGLLLLHKLHAERRAAAKSGA